MTTWFQYFIVSCVWLFSKCIKTVWLLFRLVHTPLVGGIVRFRLNDVYDKFVHWLGLISITYILLYCSMFFIELDWMYVRIHLLHIPTYCYFIRRYSKGRNYAIWFECCLSSLRMINWLYLSVLMALLTVLLGDRGDTIRAWPKRCNVEHNTVVWSITL